MQFAPDSVGTFERPLCLGTYFKATICAATVGVIWLSPTTVSAAGFAAARFGGEHGSVVTTNPTALYYNPAGLGFSEGTHVFVDATVALRNVTWLHPTSPDGTADPPDADGANTGKAELSNVLF